MTIDKDLMPTELIQSKIMVIRGEKVMIACPAIWRFDQGIESGGHKKQKAVPVRFHVQGNQSGKRRTGHKL